MVTKNLKYLNFLWGFYLLIALGVVFPCLAQELEPRRWSHLPIGTNFAGAGFAYTDAEIAVDPILRAENVELEMRTWAATYIRTFELFGKSARIDLSQGYQQGRWSGVVDGVSTEIYRSGFTDSLMRFAINLMGAPPLSDKEYAVYRAKTDPETIIGLGLGVQLPTGEYMDDKLINLGTNRFTFRPQFGLLHKRGNWSMELSDAAWFYTDNNDFFNGSKLEQDLLYILHGHLIYTFASKVWAGISAGFDYGGQSTIDGVEKDDRKENIAWAFSIGYPLTRHLGVKAAYIARRTQETVGSDSDTVAVGFSLF